MEKVDRSYICRNSECQKEFDTPKEVTYYVCPFCETRLEDEKSSRPKCSRHFGYLGERKSGEVIPSECIECMRSIECMLSKVSSKDAAEEIQKWYK